MGSRPKGTLAQIALSQRDKNRSQVLSQSKGLKFISERKRFSKLKSAISRPEFFL
jgi:hypothetical protein